MVFEKMKGRFSGLPRFLAGVAAGLLMTSALAVAQEENADKKTEAAVAAKTSAEEGADAKDSAPPSPNKELTAKIAALEAELARARSKCGGDGDLVESSERDDLATRIRKMKPDAAARLLATLELELAVDIFRRLDDRSSARILDKMPVMSATKIVSAMAGEKPEASVAQRPDVGAAERSTEE